MITINPQAADVITIQLSDADRITLNTTAIVIEDRDAGTLDGQNGAYYLDRDNHTGTQAISTVDGLQDALDSKLGSVAWGNIGGSLTAQTDLQTALDAKLDSADYNDRFLGLYASILELETAHPTANAGDYAQVDWGIGTDVIVYVYDVDDAQWIPVGSSPIANTDALPEGSTNLYFTGQRVRDTPLTGLSTASATPITAADSVLSAVGKLQGQASAAATAIAGKLSTADAPATVRATALTGLSLATATPITAADTVLSAAGKLQAQITAAGSGSVARRMPVGFWQTATGVFAGGSITLNSAVVQYVYFYVPQTITISQVSLNAPATQAGGEFKLRFYDLVDNAAVSPEYVIPAAGSGLITYTLPSPLTIPAGNYFFGLLTNAAVSRQVIGIGQNNGVMAFPSADGILGTNRSEGRLYANGLPATATLGASAGGGAPNINFLVTA